jgi:hypothetical protein
VLNQAGNTGVVGCQFRFKALRIPDNPQMGAGQGCSKSRANRLPGQRDMLLAECRKEDVQNDHLEDI